MRLKIVKRLPASVAGRYHTKAYNGEHAMKQMTERARREEADKARRMNAAASLEGPELVEVVKRFYNGESNIMAEGTINAGGRDANAITPQGR